MGPLEDVRFSQTPRRRRRIRHAHRKGLRISQHSERTGKSNIVPSIHPIPKQIQPPLSLSPNKMKPYLTNPPPRRPSTYPAHLPYLTSHLISSHLTSPLISNPPPHLVLPTYLPIHLFYPPTYPPILPTHLPTHLPTVPRGTHSSIPGRKLGPWGSLNARKSRGRAYNRLEMKGNEMK